jgi:hypothetical protein
MFDITSIFVAEALSEVADLPTKGADRAAELRLRV